MDPKKDVDNNPLKDLDKIDDDDLANDDYFEKLLNTPVDDDPEGAGDPKADDDPDPNNNKKDDEPTREELEKENAQLKKEAKGRLNDTVKSRQEKRQMKDDLLRLQGAVTSLFDKNKEPDTKSPKPLEDPRKTVEFDDDKAIVDLSEVKAFVQEEKQDTQKQLDEIKQAEMVRSAKDEYDRTVNEVIDTNRTSYEPAYVTLKNAVVALNDRLIEVQDRTNTLGDPKTGGVDVDMGLDLLDGTPEEKAFMKDFPGLNPIHIARAFNSKRDLRTALDNIAGTQKDPNANADDPETGKLNDKLLDEARKKPNSLAGQENRSTTDALLEKIGSLKSADLLDISDAEEEKILKLLEQEELRGEN